jgi:hypothetical protein
MHSKALFDSQSMPRRQVKAVGKIELPTLHLLDGTFQARPPCCHAKGSKPAREMACAPHLASNCRACNPLCALFTWSPPPEPECDVHSARRGLRARGRSARRGLPALGHSARRRLNAKVEGGGQHGGRQEGLPRTTRLKERILDGNCDPQRII